MPTHQTVSDQSRTLREAGKFAEAEDVCRRWLRANEGDADVWNELGVALGQQGKLHRAVAALQRAIASRPDYLPAYRNLALAYQKNNELERAADVSLAALRIYPNSAETLAFLGSILGMQRKEEEAARCFEAALRHRPSDNDIRARWGKALTMSGDLDRGIPVLLQTIAADPQNLPARHELVAAYRLGNRIDDAFAMVESILGLNPNDVEAIGLRAHLRLVSGDFRGGWPDYEHRWRSASFSDKERIFAQPKWTGQDLRGRTILLYGEQGSGDRIQFIRYATLLADRGAKVVVETDLALVPLVKTVKGVASIVLTGWALPKFDCHCPLLSLPGVFGTALQNVPANVPYLSARKGDVTEWAEKLQPYDDKLKIGLAWAGSPTHKFDRRRSLPLATLAPFSAVNDVAFFSLQKGPAASQAATPPAGMNLVDLSADLADFGDTAGLIANLDLVISVDTAVAHLAGAMAKPVWTLLPFSPDWRWLLNRDNSPWYPTMRLFRQPALGDWESIIRNVTAALRSRSG